jgi:hypothetical protein
MTDLHYLSPSNSSGALYHKVTISLVKSFFLIGKLKVLANPKSAILIFPSLDIRIF